MPLRRLVLACVSTAAFAFAISIAAPVRQISGDTVPNRYGAALLRCGGGFDLERVEWIAALEHLPYWAQRDAEGHVVSVFGPGPAVVGALGFLDFGDGDALDDASLRSRERLVSAVLLAIAAGLLVLSAAARRGLVTSAVIGALAAASFAGAATLGQALWQQSVALPVLVGALGTLAWQHRYPRVSLLTPALLVSAVLLRSTIAPLVLGLGIAWCLDRRSSRAWVGACGLAVLAALPFVAWNTVHLGTPLPVGQLQANAHVTDHIFQWSPGSLGYALGGLLISPGRGLLWYAPIALVGIVTALRRAPRDERVIAVAAVVQLFAVASFHMWWGGVCFGPRFLAEVTWIGIWLATSARARVGHDDAARPRSRVASWAKVAAVIVTVGVGQLGLWAWRVEQWETRRLADIDQNALWDVVDSPITAMLRDIDDQPMALDTLHAPGRVRCVAGRLRSVR